MKNKNIFIVLAVLVISALGYFSYNWYVNNNKSCCGDNTIVPQNPNVLTKDDFEFEYTYKGDNVWNYSISGKFPNLCYSGIVEGLVRESYPEQVSIVLTVKGPKADQMCALAIKDFSYEGTFNASENATVDFQVKTIVAE